MRRFFWTAFALYLPLAARAGDGPGDNIVDKVRRVPPPGIEVPAADKEELSQGMDQLGKAIADLRVALKGKPSLELLPDVQIYHNAVRYALQHNEIYQKKEIATAKKLLQQG